MAAVSDHTHIDYITERYGTVLLQTVVKSKTHARPHGPGEGLVPQILALHDPQYNALQYNTVAPAGLISILCFAITWVYLHSSFHYLFIQPILSAKSLASPLSNSSQGVVLSLIRHCQPTNALTVS